jgi:hypothetical protein
VRGDGKLGLKLVWLLQMNEWIGVGLLKSTCMSFIGTGVVRIPSHCQVFLYMPDIVAYAPLSLFNPRLKLKFFHSLSITSIFARMHEALNIDKKNN